MTNIILVNYNNFEDTIKCCNSLLKMNSNEFRIIIIDNKSPNDSMKKLLSWAESLTEYEYDYYNNSNEESSYLTSSAKITLIQSSNNNGFASGNNIGLNYSLKNTDFDFIWMLNNDTIVEENFLDKMLNSYKKDSIFGCKILDYDNKDIVQSLGGTEIISWKSFGTQITSLSKNQILEKNVIRIDGYIYGASMFYNKSVLKKVGLLNENFFMFGEETEWCIRARKVGIGFFSNIDCIIYHKKGASSNKDIIKKIFGRESKRNSINRFIIRYYYDLRNYIYILKLHYPKKVLIGILFKLPRIIKLILGILVYDNNKLLRIKLVIKAIIDGYTFRLGKTIDPQMFNSK